MGRVDEFQAQKNSGEHVGNLIRRNLNTILLTFLEEILDISLKQAGNF